MTSSAPSSQAPCTQSRRYSMRNYFWVFIFKYDVHTEKPFSILNLNGLKTENFPQYLVLGPLTEKGRLQQFPLSPKGGMLYSVFCKVEKGNK